MGACGAHRCGSVGNTRDSLQNRFWSRHKGALVEKTVTLVRNQSDSGRERGSERAYWRCRSPHIAQAGACKEITMPGSTAPQPGFGLEFRPRSAMSDMSSSSGTSGAWFRCWHNSHAVARATLLP